MLTRIGALTAEDKAAIERLCGEAGLKVTFKSGCADCWRDGLILLAKHYGVSLTEREDVLTPSGNYVFHYGSKKVVWWYRHTYHELSAQSSDATIQLYMAVHPLQTHFSVVETETVEPDIDAESVEQVDGGETGSPEPESGLEGQNIDTDEGVNSEGDNDGKEQGNETDE